MTNERHDLPPAAGVEAGSSLQALIAELADRLREVLSLFTDPCPYDAGTTKAAARNALAKAEALLSVSGASGGRCPYCSFDPTNMNDYCEKHRPLPAAPGASGEKQA